MRIDIRRLIMLGTAALVAALALAAGPGTASAAAAKYVVDDDLVECPGAAYSGAAGVQNAVNIAVFNKVHTIVVCAGTYSKFVVTGANGLKIVAHDPANRPRVNAPTANGGVIVDVQNSKNVTLDGLYLNGENFVDGGANAMTGVLYHNSSGIIQNMVIYGVASFPDFSAATARAISLIDDDGNNKTSSVKVTRNYLNTYQTTGVYAEGRVKLTMTGNTLLGQDHAVLTSDAPQAGVEMTANANGTPSGSISTNYLNYNLTGVLLHSVPKIKISGNDFDLALHGVAISAVCFAPGSSADKNRITGNRFAHMAEFAVAVYAVTELSTPCPSHANNTLISGNFMHANGDGEPVAIGGETISSGPFPASINKIQIIKNTTFGFLNLVDITGATNAVVKQNKMYHK